MVWSKLEQQGKLYGRRSRDGKNHHPGELARLRTYQVRMRRKPTRAEQRMKRILYDFFGLHPASNKKKVRKCFKEQKIFMFDNHRFLRAKGIKGYLVDFYLPKYKLVIEVDGDSHDNPYSKSYDDTRTAILNDKDIKVLRVTNEQTHDKALCLNMICKVIKFLIIKRKIYKNSNSIFSNMSREEELFLQKQAISKGKLKRYKSY